MDQAELKALLERVAGGESTVDEAFGRLSDLPFAGVCVGEHEVAKVDHHRGLRTGFPEVVFCEGKTPQQVRAIAREVLEKGDVLLGTRASASHFQIVAQISADARYFEEARILLVDRREERPQHGNIAVVTAGTADYAVAEEAAISAEVMGNRVTRLYDVGVAGIHRLLARREVIREARVVVAVAGMEGALPSIVAGLVAAPVIAVPTSVGYGANLGGIATLLAMLNSCAAGLGVVNIDNGFGAAALASRINQAACEGQGAGGRRRAARSAGEPERPAPGRRRGSGGSKEG